MPEPPLLSLPDHDTAILVALRAAGRAVTLLLGGTESTTAARAEEKAEVSPVVRLVAVAVTNWPEDRVVARVLVKLTCPAALVVTVVLPRRAFPWAGEPDELAKNSRANEVLAVLVSEPPIVV